MQEDLVRKAQLVIDLLKAYFKNRDVECYNLLCGYNPETDLEISEYPNLDGGFWFIIIDSNYKVAIQITNTKIDKVYTNNPEELIEVVNFYDLYEIHSIEDCGSWNKTINWLKENI